MKIPVFTIEPLLKSIHFEQVGYQRATFKEARSLKKADKVIRKSLKTPARWVYIKHSDKTHPVLLNTSGDVTKIISGPKSLLLKSAKTEKDLEYWKKKLLDSLKMEKSLEEIFFPTMYKSLPEKAEEQIKMLKARGYDVGTVREWKGKKYKKMGSGKWVRFYSEAESRGAKQAIRNVKKKILNAKTMQELVDIVKENKSRFMGEDGKALPIIKEFMEAARITDAGKKEAESKQSFKEGYKAKLKNEASKYKTEEEFIKKQGTPVYHGTDNKVDKLNIERANEEKKKKGDQTKFEEAVYLTPDKNLAKDYGKQVLNVYVDKNAKRIDYDQIKYEDDFYDFVDEKVKENPNYDKLNSKSDYAKEKGFDIVDYGGNEIVVFNDKIIATEKELKDIWEERTQNL